MLKRIFAICTIIITVLIYSFVALIFKTFFGNPVIYLRSYIFTPIYCYVKSGEIANVNLIIYNFKNKNYYLEAPLHNGEKLYITDEGNILYPKYSVEKE